MCEHCGCDSATGGAADCAGGHSETRHSAHDHDHPHPHPPGHPHEHADRVAAAPDPAAGAETRRVAVEADILAANAAAAVDIRRQLAERGVTAFNLMSSPGSGKTRLLEATLDRLRGRVGCAVITGDVRTDHDARRLAGRGAPVRQIETMNACHLSAVQIAEALPHVLAPDTRLLFIENVGNLVCPATFDLGEHVKVALLSVVEGEDKPVKYPAMFTVAGVVVLTKIDLAGAAEWDRAAALRAVQTVRPGAVVFEVSAKTGEGMDAWIGYLERVAG